MRSIFDFNSRRNSLGAVILFFAHCIVFFIVSMAFLLVLNYILPMIAGDLTDQQLAMIINYTLRSLGGLYALFVAYNVAKNFDKGPRLFAIVFSVGSAIALNVFMGFLLPVMMTTMLPERT